MKSGKPIFFIAGILSYFFLIFMLSSFGNKYSHPKINQYMVEAFLKDPDFRKMPALKNVSFLMDTKLSGIAVTKGGWYYIDEEEKNYEVQDWIKHGGFAADEPEVKNSLRHFYDPTEPAGDRFLSDYAKGVFYYLQNLGETNPRIDGVEWAVNHADHDYNWIHGKIAFKNAFEEPDKDEKNRLMAGAWRSFGETLHMIADNCTPAHVRNDAHPSVLGESKYVGDPDTFEEYMDHLGKNDIKTFSDFANKTADKTLTSVLRKSDDIRTLAHALATYTNKNFFSSQTLYGIDEWGNAVNHAKGSHKTYTSPKISKGIIDSDGYYVWNGVRVCKQAWWVGVGGEFSEVYIDHESVKSQAGALIPAAIEAGKNAFRLFMPEVYVEIKSYNDVGEISGQIRHVKSTEYPLAITYNGPVEILDKRKKKVAQFEAENGVFYGKLDKKESEIYAFVSFGGVAFTSEPAFGGGDDKELYGGEITIVGPSKYTTRTTGADGSVETYESTDNVYFSRRFDEANAEISNGAVTGFIDDEPKSRFSLTYNPATGELISFQLGGEWTSGSEFSGNYKVSVQNIPDKYFSGSSTYYTWKVEGNATTSYITTYEDYFKGLYKDSNGNYSHTFEELYQGIQASSENELKIQLIWK